MPPGFCPDAERVPGADLTTSLKIFRDKWGARWICPRHFTCSHSVVMHGQMVMCRKRDAEIRQMEAGTE